MEVEVPNRSVSPSPRRYVQPQEERRRLPPRTCCLAMVLTVLGVTLFVGAVVALAVGHDGGAAPLFLLAALTLLPGCYATIHLVGVSRRWPGYYDNVSALADLELV